MKLGTLKVRVDVASISEGEIKAQFPEVFNGVGNLKSRKRYPSYRLQSKDSRPAPKGVHHSISVTKYLK